jgi:hypothetical protein
MSKIKKRISKHEEDVINVVVVCVIFFAIALASYIILPEGSRSSNSSTNLPNYWNYLSILFAGILLLNFFGTKYLIYRKKPKIIQQLWFEGVGQKSVAEPFNTVNQIEKGHGYLTFDCPALMAIDKEEIVIAEVFTAIQFYIQLADKSKTEQIEVTSEMSARLFGHDFEITTLNNESQALFPQKKTKWQWEVKPTKRGDKQIKLVISATIKSQFGDRQLYDFDPVVRPVIVKVKGAYVLKKFLKSNWQWIVNLIAGTGLTISILKAFNIID